MSGRRSRTRHALGAATEGRSRSLALYAPSSAAEGRSRSLTPSGRSTYTQPSTVDASLLPWPPLQRTRDLSVRLQVERLVGPGPYSQRYGAVPEPDAKLVAAAIEAEAFASASEFASGATLSSDAERMEVYRTYCEENCRRLLEFFKSRAATSGA
ncbi:unnamed protein product [Alopecurus aequalis]